MIYNLQDWQKKVLLHVLNGEAGVNEWVEGVEAKPEMFPNPNKIIEDKISRVFDMMKWEYGYLNFDGLTNQQIVDLILSQPAYKDRENEELPPVITLDKLKSEKIDRLAFNNENRIYAVYPLSAQVQVLGKMCQYDDNDIATMKNFISTCMGEHDILKAQIEACATIEEVDAIDINLA